LICLIVSSNTTLDIESCFLIAGIGSTLIGSQLENLSILTLTSKFKGNRCKKFLLKKIANFGASTGRLSDFGN
jgi:hypothetical protein